jgi:aminoglycoside phosphotransferase (APT) family kinase protein
VALKNKIDTDLAAKKLADWLGTKFTGAQDIQVTDLRVPNAAGMSNETVLFTASWRENGNAEIRGMVARVQPDGPGVYPAYDLSKEARVITALSEHSSIAVPELYFYEEDPSVFGSPFLVMKRVDGQVPGDDPPFTAAGFVLDLTPEQRQQMWFNSIDVLAQVHATDWRSLGLGFLASPEHHGGVDGQLKLWRDTFEWAAEGVPNPTMEAALHWLDANRPADLGEQVLCWGDARVGNIVYDDNLSAAAILDWEMVTVASREYELGWFLFTTLHHTEGIGVALPDGIPDRAATVARYQQITGHTVQNLNYYEIFAGVRLAIIMVRAAHMLMAAGMLPLDSTMEQNNGASQLVAKLIGLPPPAGASGTYVGSRGEASREQ